MARAANSCWVRFYSSTWNVLWSWNNNKRRRWSLKENNQRTQIRSYWRIHGKPNEAEHWRYYLLWKLYSRIYCIIMLGESKPKPYNITLKNVVQTMVKTVIEITNDLERLSFLKTWRHGRPVAPDARARCVTARIARRESTNETSWTNWYIPVSLLSSIEQWAYQAFPLNQ